MQPALVLATDPTVRAWLSTADGQDALARWSSLTATDGRPWLMADGDLGDVPAEVRSRYRVVPSPAGGPALYDARRMVADFRRLLSGTETGDAPSAGAGVG